MRPKRAVASFDSASTFHRVLAQHLHGTGSPALGLGPAARAVSYALPLVNRMPRTVREILYIWSGWSEAIRQGQAGTVDTDAIAEWACEQYPRRTYPAVLIPQPAAGRVPPPRAHGRGGRRGRRSRVAAHEGREKPMNVAA